MKTKLLYVLVSSPEDNYLEMAHISITSAKYHMPDCHIVLLVDDQTDRLMDDNRRKILKNVDEYIVVPLEQNTSAHVRSRLIKCGARKYVKGDFLYIDTDTIIVKPLYDIDQTVSSIAAVRNLHVDYSEVYQCFNDSYAEGCRVLDFSIENEDVLFNGGVMFVKDDDIAHRFYEMWLNEWEKGSQKILKDQPALTKANMQMGHVIQKLDDTWNVQIAHGIKYMKDARICHYFISDTHYESQAFALKSPCSFHLLKEDLDNVNNAFFMNLMNDPFYGINDTSMLITGNELFLRQTKLYSIIYYWFTKKNKQFNRIQYIIKTIGRIIHR